MACDLCHLPLLVAPGPHPQSRAWQCGIVPERLSEQDASL